MKKKLKVALAIIILAGTLGAFIHYANTHPALIHKLGEISPGLMVLLIGCYIVWFLALFFVLRISLRMYGKSMSRQENLMLNAYSSLVNFFGPGQSGPAFRGLYLKKRMGLRIKNYLFATVLYYGFYAVISALLLFVGSRPWWQTVSLVAAAVLGSLIIIRWYAKRSRIKDEPGINFVNLSLLFAATAVQVLMQALIFYIELRDVSSHVSIAQTLTYTGAANFALFVSLTPGAIGIREAFLVFSQNLHHISSTVIVAANVIDRAVYLLFLGILAILALGLHAKDRLRIKQLTQEQE